MTVIEANLFKANAEEKKAIALDCTENLSYYLA